MKKILIVGSNGLIGHGISKKLIKNNIVINLDIKRGKYTKNFYKCDITNEKHLSSTIKKIINK